MSAAAGQPSSTGLPTSERGKGDSLKATATAREQSPRPRPHVTCAACRRALAQKERSFRGAFTQCELANNAVEFRAEFFWLSAGGRVFRVPREWAKKQHPGGLGALEKGSSDANEAFSFHTERGQAAWRTFEVGYLVPCPNGPRPRCDIV